MVVEVPNMLFPSAISCFPVLVTIPVSLVSSSEKCGGSGTLASMRSKGKYSLEGSPPPNDIKPMRARKKHRWERVRYFAYQDS